MVQQIIWKNRHCKVYIELLPLSVLISVYTNNKLRMSAISINNIELTEDINDALKYIKYRTCRKWLTNLFKTDNESYSYFK